MKKLLSLYAYDDCLVEKLLSSFLISLPKDNDIRDLVALYNTLYLNIIVNYISIKVILKVSKKKVPL